MQVFSIRVTPVDDGTPILDVNLGLQYLDMVQGEVSDDRPTPASKTQQTDNVQGLGQDMYVKSEDVTGH